MQRLGEVRADEPGGAGDGVTHRVTLPARLCKQDPGAADVRALPAHSEVAHMFRGGTARPPDVNGERMDPDDMQPAQTAAAQDTQRARLVQAAYPPSRARSTRP